MSKQASPTLIGAFVVGAIALLASAVLLFGGTEIFARETRFVANFSESVKGLRTGANVLFRGVRIGFVENIQLLGDVNTLESQVQVTMRIFPDQFKLTRSGTLLQAATQEYYTAQELIDAGMHAQLGVESYVTGQLLIEVDITPGGQGQLSGVSSPHPEIPTIPNDIQQLVDNVRSFIAELQAKVDVDKLAADVQGAIHGINELANSEDLRNTLAGLNQFVNAEATQSLPLRLGDTIDTVNHAIEDTRRLVNNADEKIDTVADELRPIVTGLNETLSAAEQTLKHASTQLQGDTELSYQVNGTLNEVERAVRSLRIFLDYIERNPDALLRGKRQ